MMSFLPVKCNAFPGWYEISGYDGYVANDEGKIKNKKTGHETLGGVSGRYRRVSVYPNGRKKPVLAYSHDLVCTAYHGPRPKGKVVLHTNDDRLDCQPNNLAWGTQSKNITDVWKNGLRGSNEAAKPTLSYPLYHLSLDSNLPGLLKPRSVYLDETIPEEYYQENAPWPYPEPATPRVSFSPTVVQCYRAIYPNVMHLFEQDGYPHIDIYLYQAKLTGKEEIILPETLTKERWVWDAHITQEHWLMDPVNVELVSRYRFYNQLRQPVLTTRPFGNRILNDSGDVGPRTVKYREVPIRAGLESLPLSVDW